VNKVGVFRMTYLVNLSVDYPLITRSIEHDNNQICFSDSKIIVKR
jgi:hypothetical protein